MSAIAQVQPMTSTRALRGPFDYRLPAELRERGVDVGSMLVVPFARRQVLGVVVGMAEGSEISEEKLLAPLRALDESPSAALAPPGASAPSDLVALPTMPTLPVELVELAHWIAAEYCSTTARALTLVLPPGAARALSGRRRGQVRVRSKHVPVGAHRPEPPALTPAQSEAYAALAQALDTRRYERRLLQGVTGSGKTEVYLLAAAHALEQDRGAIVLVPEIALTPQIVTRFRERFGETVAVLHSKLRPGERYSEWRRLRTGEARVCVGPRSAVFAPIEGLGLIVLDEEHESSYKHEGDPRYDARAVAEQRARIAGALLLLGSATPRPESVYSVAPMQEPSGSLPGGPMRAEPGARLRLPARVDGGALPRVDVLDMCGHGAGLHPETVRALAHVRETGGKAIVLLNRRGWSNFLSCHSCGHVWSCPQCDVTLVFHRRGGYIACHHCGHRQAAPERCEQCGSISVARHGAGTERVQHDLTLALDAEEQRFPVLRLDADTAEAQGGVAPLLRRFQDAPAGVLIGTQMVAKGHDFPDVGLGVVIDADATLRFPDFRAEERTFALIAQLAGRVGRGAAAGGSGGSGGGGGGSGGSGSAESGAARVLVQTIAPTARAIVHAAAHDSDGFLAGELERRRALAYPPFSQLIRIVCAAPEGGAARGAALALAGELRGLDAGVLGPASLFRLRGQERQVLVIKARDRRLAVTAVGAAVARLAGDRTHRGVSFSVDVDPQ